VLRAHGHTCVPGDHQYVLYVQCPHPSSSSSIRTCAYFSSRFPLVTLRFRSFSTHACVNRLGSPRCLDVLRRRAAATLGFLFFSCRCRRRLSGQYAAGHIYTRTYTPLFLLPDDSRLPNPCAWPFLAS
jgi:hypothetical protein